MASGHMAIVTGANHGRPTAPRDRTSSLDASRRPNINHGSKYVSATERSGG